MSELTEICCFKKEKFEECFDILLNRISMNFCNYISFQDLKLNNSIEILKKLLKKKTDNYNILSMLLECKYIDRTFRDSYYLHLSEKHFEVSRYCQRLIIFDGIQEDNIINRNVGILEKNLIGSIVIRPIKTGILGRTLINPKYLYKNKDEYKEDNAYIRTTKYSISFYGICLSVSAFPFSTQDAITTTCAETTLINMMDYFSHRYEDYRLLLPSDIYKIRRQDSDERILPTKGMTYRMLSKAMYKSGLYPKIYTENEYINFEDMRRILSYYVESGIPVALGIHRKCGGLNHSIICIGHTSNDYNSMTNIVYPIINNCSQENKRNIIYTVDTANSINKLIVMDDTNVPYSQFKLRKLSYDYKDSTFTDIHKLFKYEYNDSELMCIIVPLYKRVYMDVMQARNAFREILVNDDFNPCLNYKKCFNFDVGTRENPIVTRIFLTSSKHYKEMRLNDINIVDTCVEDMYLNTPFPQFIWVCELYDLKCYKNGIAFGEIILDATYSSKDSLGSIIMLNYPQKHLARDIDGKSLDATTDIEFNNTSEHAIKFSMYHKNLTSMNEL